MDELRIKSIAENETWLDGSVHRGNSVVLWIDGLPENVDVNNTRVTLSGRRLRVTYAGNGQVNATVPEDSETGEHAIAVEVGSAKTTGRIGIL